MTLLYLVAWPLVWLASKTVWRLKIRKLAPIPDGPIVLCCNHMHALDPLTLAMVTTRQVHYMAKKELMPEKGFSEWLLRSLGSFPVNRESNDVKSMRHTMTLLKEGKIVGIFPEGHRSVDGIVHEFHPGAAMFALRTEAKLIPVGIYSTFRFFAKTRIVVGQEIDLSGYRGRRTDSDDIQRVNAQLFERIKELAEMAKEMK